MSDPKGARAHIQVRIDQVLSCPFLQPGKPLVARCISSVGLCQWGHRQRVHQTFLGRKEPGFAWFSQTLHDMDKHQKVPETAELRTVVTEFEEAGVPMVVALAKDLLGKMFDSVVEDGEVFARVAAIHHNCTSLQESNLPAK
jgi:hypothetical protein